MAEFKGTPHNAAKPGDVAKTVLMPGDPLRAKYIAETFLEDAKMFNSIRGMYGYTGKWKGREVSVMASGMGIPSMGIYSYELFAFYGVENIVRIGSTGSALPTMSIVVASKSYSLSSYAKVAYDFEENYLLPSAELNEIIIKTAEEAGKSVHVGPVRSGDLFYEDNEKTVAPFPEKIIGLEMESFGLFANARHFGKRAACIATVTDSFGEDAVELSPEARQTALNDMIEIALNAAIKF